MIRLKILLFPLLFLSVYSMTCPDNSNIPIFRLRDDVLCNYDYNIRPVKDHQKAVNVSFQFLMKYFNYEVYTSSLTLDSWLYVNWKDEHLKWDPTEYDGIKKILITTDEIWVPDFSSYTRSSESGSAELISDSKCTVFNTGAVACVCPSHIDALCVPDLTKFPYDTQNCSLTLGSWSHSGEEINIRAMGLSGVSIEELEPNGEWELSQIQTVKHDGKYDCCPNTTYPSIRISFIINRLHGSHTASVVVPFLAIIFLTFISLCISPSNKDRLKLCYLNVIVQFMNLQYISYLIPMKGDNIPYLLQFARDSLLLAVFTVFFSVIFKRLLQKKQLPPQWVSYTVAYVINTRVSNIILAIPSKEHSALEEDRENIINNSEETQSKDWLLFVRFLDVILFILYVMIYFVMVLKWIP